MCVCFKEECEEPKVMSYKCKDCAKMGFMLTKNNVNLIAKLHYLYKSGGLTVYIAPTCRGCRFTKEQIEEEYQFALASGIEQCIYKKENEEFIYEGDALSEEFEKYLIKNKIKPKIMDLITEDPNNFKKI